MRTFTKKADAGGYGKMVGFALILVLAFIVAAVFTAPIAVYVEKNILTPIKEKLEFTDKQDEEKKTEQQRVATELTENAKKMYATFTEMLDKCTAPSQAFCQCGTLDYLPLTEYSLLVKNSPQSVSLVDKTYVPVKDVQKSFSSAYTLGFLSHGTIPQPSTLMPPISNPFFINREGVLLDMEKNRMTIPGDLPLTFMVKLNSRNIVLLPYQSATRITSKCF